MPLRPGRQSWLCALTSGGEILRLKGRVDFLRAKPVRSFEGNIRAKPVRSFEGNIGKETIARKEALIQEMIWSSAMHLRGVERATSDR